MSEYGIDDIESLTFKEGVRKRIQMYLGSDDLEGTYQALKEIINNAAEAVKFTSTGTAANTSVLEECVKTFMPSQNQDDAVSYNYYAVTL